MTSQTHDRHQLDRLAYFSDAVFAIAITLLIIEIGVPHLPEPLSEAALANSLLALIPNYIGFLISFFVIGRFWIGHHRAFGQLDRADAELVWRNLLFLLTIAFMPFPTALISEYVNTRVGVGFYAAWLTLSGLLNVHLVRHAMRGPLIASHVDAAEPRLALRAAWAPTVIGVLAFAAAMIQPVLAMVPLLASPIIVRLFTREWTKRA